MVTLMSIKKIIVDGSNVAFATKIQNKATFSNLKRLKAQLDELIAENPKILVEIVCDASLKYSIDDPTSYELWLQEGILKQVPPKTNADTLIIQYMQAFDGEILLISNDLFRDHPEIAALKHRQQWGFIIAFGSIQFTPLNIANSTPKKTRSKHKKHTAPVALTEA
jgi:hypothetical protein